METGDIKVERIEIDKWPADSGSRFIATHKDGRVARLICHNWHHDLEEITLEVVIEYAIEVFNKDEDLWRWEGWDYKFIQETSK